MTSTSHLKHQPSSASLHVPGESDSELVHDRHVLDRRHTAFGDDSAAADLAGFGDSTAVGSGGGGDDAAGSVDSGAVEYDERAHYHTSTQTSTQRLDDASRNTNNARQNLLPIPQDLTFYQIRVPIWILVFVIIGSIGFGAMMTYLARKLLPRCCHWTGKQIEDDIFNE